MIRPKARKPIHLQVLVTYIHQNTGPVSAVLYLVVTGEQGGQVGREQQLVKLSHVLVHHGVRPDGAQHLRRPGCDATQAQCIYMASPVH